MFRVLLASIVLMVSNGCSTVNDVMAKANDGKTGKQTTFKTTNCTVPNADGVRCDTKTCKADAASDCSRFMEGCVNYGNNYSGSKEGGTCTRANGTPT
jgi:hypothetical protein